MSRLLDIFSWTLWWALLVSPATTLFSSQHAWDLSPYTLVMVTLWIVLLAWTVVGRRWFLLATCPVAVLGALLVAADLVRHVNLAELVLVGAVRSDEALAALGPYRWAGAGLAAALLALALLPLLTRNTPRPAPLRARRPAIFLLAVVGVGLAAASPGAFLRAWPINMVAFGVARTIGHEALLATMLPYAPINPRDPSASWHARRAGLPPAAAEIYVLIVGESVRADRLQACGNLRAVRLATQGVLTFCDVTSGSSSTHTSVPLLLSRESPGGLLRISSDATFIKAFEEAGFDTWWLSVQEPHVAWPDARHVQYVAGAGATGAGNDRWLAPLLQRALAAPAPKKLIVLHTYDAHFNYCERFDRARADWPVDCAVLDQWPSVEQRPLLLDAYDNAVQESMRFVDHVIEASGASGALAMVLYTSDHGENIYDDQRQLFQHALTTPTRWDTRVPALLWASPAWKNRYPARWKQLQSNVAAPVMHADLVPTLLGAAAIEYAEPRANVVDLGAASPGKRMRPVLRHLGDTVDGDRL